VSNDSALLSPPASTRESRLRIVARVPAGTFPETFKELPAFRFSDGDLVDIGFDTEGEDGTEERSKWDMLLGLLIVVAVSGSFWAGVGWLIARLVR